MSEQEHIEHEHIEILEHYPPHIPREGDPYYHIFNETRERMRREGKLKCYIDNKDCSKESIELHHYFVEYALIGDADWRRFAELYPQFHIPDEEAFFMWCESEENLMPLCKFHHTGIGGIHHLPAPLWLIQRFLKPGVEAPAVIVLQSQGETVYHAHR